LNAFIFKTKTFKSSLVAFFLGGLLLFYCWLGFKSVWPSLPTAQNPVMLYSNQARQDLKLTFCHALKEAKSSIDIQIYSLTDPTIKLLLSKKQKEGVLTRIAYDPKATPNLKSHFQHANPIKMKGLMHRKLIVCDGLTTFLGTANLTPQSLSMHDNLVVGIYHPPLAAFLQAPNASHFSFTLGARSASLWLLPDPTRAALHSLVSLISEARKTIRVAMFTLTHPLLIDALKKARARGVDVKIAVDFYTGKGASLKGLKALREAKIPIYLSQGLQLLHHKWAFIDDKRLIIGSANWTKAAFEKNQDCFLILHSLSHRNRRFLKKLWKTIELESRIQE
jgi:cardiolipin synthase A/B